MNSDTMAAPWYTNLLLAAGVILTVVMALLMSQLDRLQTRLVPTVPVVAQVTEPVITPTPLSAIVLATALPPHPTPAISGDEAGVPATAVPTIACGQPPDGWVAYTVKAGDTLFGLAQDTGAAVDEIVRSNCLEMQPLVIGMQIYLPVMPPPQIVCGPPASWVRYTVQAGDTLFSLARSRGTTVSRIMTANCLVSTRLYTGRQIYLPPGGATAVPTATATPPPPPTQPPPPTNTAVPPTSTATPPPVATMTPTATNTAVPVTPTNTATATATPSATATTAPPTATFTPTGTATTAPLPTDTPTPVPPTSTATNTPVPPTSTSTPTNTAVPPTATPTDTPTPP